MPRARTPDCDRMPRVASTFASPEASPPPSKETARSHEGRCLARSSRRTRRHGPRPGHRAPQGRDHPVTSSGICGSDLHLYEVLGPYLDAMYSRVPPASERVTVSVLDAASGRDAGERSGVPPTVTTSVPRSASPIRHHQGRSAAVTPACTRKGLRHWPCTIARTPAITRYCPYRVCSASLGQLFAPGCDGRR